MGGSATGQQPSTGQGNRAYALPSGSAGTLPMRRQTAQTPDAAPSYTQPMVEVEPPGSPSQKPDLSRYRQHRLLMNPQGLGGNQDWEDILSRLTQGGQGGGRGNGNPWQGGLAQLRDRYTQGRQGGGAITNPGSLAASQGAQTASGITAPGSVTGATATPTGANPHSPASGQGSPTTHSNNSHAQQLVQALRARAGR